MAIFSRHSRYSWLFAVWLIVGIVIAWGHSYLGLHLVKLVVSALFGVFLWPLVLLGLSLHVH